MFELNQLEFVFLNGDVATVGRLNFFVAFHKE
jgi:hypothetical protein